MNCYYCDEKPGPGGTRIHNVMAIGICHDCGVAVCRHHRRKFEGNGRLCCWECAQMHALANASPGAKSRRTA